LSIGPISWEIILRTTVTGHYQGVNELKERELPSLAKEGCREAAGWFDQEIHYWTNTPGAHQEMGHPSSAEEGSLACQLIHSHLLMTAPPFGTPRRL